MSIIKNQAELLAHYSAADAHHLKQMIYEVTPCGAFIDFTSKGIRLGSIVEGCDYGTTTYPLDYPLTAAEIDERLNAINEEASALWAWAYEREYEGNAPDVAHDHQHLLERKQA